MANRRVKDAASSSLAEAEAIGPCLSAVDLANMRHNDARVETMRARADASAWKLQYAATIGELRAMQLEAATKAEIAAARAQMENDRDTLAKGLETAKILAADVADRYSIDWRSACFDPETGRITSIPGDTEHGDRS